MGTCEEQPSVPVMLFSVFLSMCDHTAHAVHGRPPLVYANTKVLKSTPASRRHVPHDDTFPGSRACSVEKLMEVTRGSMPQVLRTALQLAICCPVPECEKLNRQLLTGTGRELLSLVHFLRLAEWPSGPVQRHWLRLLLAILLFDASPLAVRVLSCCCHHCWYPGAVNLRQPPHNQRNAPAIAAARRPAADPDPRRSAGTAGRGAPHSVPGCVADISPWPPLRQQLCLAIMAACGLEGLCQPSGC